MKNSFAFPSLLQPLYVVFASLAGIAIAKALFAQNWESPFMTVSPNGRINVLAPDYIAFVLVSAALLAFLAVIILPLWKQLFDLIRDGVADQSPFNKIGTIAMMLLGALSLIIILQAYLGFSSSFAIVPDGTWPDGLSERLNVLFVGIILTIIPVPLIGLMIYGMAHGIVKSIPSLKNDEKGLLEIAYTLIRYRTLLQNGLLIMGVIVSAVPVVTAIMRSAFIEVDKTGEIEMMWPIIYPIMYGLGFTTILVIFYAPAHLMLNQAGQELRDALCSINSLSDIEQNLKRRKELEDWLQVNLSLIENLRAGIVTLAPLITGFITSISGLKIF
jgi:hypothetical protein